MADASEARRRTPVGVVLVCLLLVLYGSLWLLTWFVAGVAGDGPLAVVSVFVAAGVLLLAYSLYLGSHAAWLVTLVFVGGSTLWRLSLVVAGRPDNLANAVVGLVLVLYLLGQHGFYRRPTS